MAEPDDLKPCPFCGSQPEATEWEVGNFGDREAGVICHGCGVRHAELVDFDVDSEAVQAALSRHISAWNRRVNAATAA